MESRRPPEQEVAFLYEAHVHRLTAVAYNIIGQWEAAEDVAEEAFARLLRNSPDRPVAWLTAVTTRQALDVAQSAEAKRTEYIGPWLPEIAAGNNVYEDVDLAVARLLQALQPIDRAVLVLSEVAGYSAAEIAKMLHTTPVAVRKRLSRARATVRKFSEDEGTTSEAPQELVLELTGLLHHGELEKFIDKVSEHAVLWVDSGGTASAARNAIIGRVKILRFLKGLFRKFGYPQFEYASHSAGGMIVAESTDMTRWVILESDDRGHEITGIQVQQNASKRKTAPCLGRHYAGYSYQNP